MEKIFYNGLKQEMKEVMKMKEPRGLPYQKAAVLGMESTSFCHLVSEKSGNRSAVAKTFANRVVVTYPKPKPLLLQGGAGQVHHPGATVKPTVQLRQRHTAEELDAMRSKGTCFKCKGKYFRGHVCPLKELQILIVVEGLELEVLDEEFSFPIEVAEEEQPVLRCLSLNSFLGIHSPRTTKLMGRIGKTNVVVLLDSGASHNFITPTLASRLKLKVCEDNDLEVLLGNGV